MAVRPFVLVVALGSATAHAALAQQPAAACKDPALVGATLQGGTACQLGFDTFNYMSPQYSLVSVAGNIEVGRADALGAFPHFRVALHVTGMSMALPAFKASGINPGPAVSSTVPTQGNDYLSFAADGALGLFGGFEVGGLKVGALDAYLSVNIAPTTSAAGYTATPSPKIYFGIGGRLGVLQEGKVIPAVGLSYVSRDLPTTTILGSDFFDNTVAVTNLNVKSHAWTITVGKHFSAVGFVLGGGQTSFSSSGTIAWSVSGQNPVGTLPTTSGSSTQSQYFGDVDFDLGTLQIALELGQVTGSELTTFNIFDPSTSTTRSYFSLAVTFGH